jgi:DNA-binding NarL/FixJ family response regulator
MIDANAAFGQKLLDVPLRERKAQAPAHGQEDHLRLKLTPLRTDRKASGPATSAHLTRPAAKSCNTSQKEALIVKALGEGMSQRAIARTLSAGRDTVRAVLKKRLTSAG